MARPESTRLERIWWLIALLGLLLLGSGVGLTVGGGNVVAGIVLVLAGGVLALWSVSIRTGVDIPLGF